MSKKFSPKQHEILDFELSLNLLVNASAGTGKTTVLSEKVARLIIEKGVSPKEILVVTFTRPAAAEMKERIRHRLFELNASESVLFELEEANFQTFDSFYMYLVRTYGHFIKVEKNLQIFDGNVYKALLKSFIEKEIHWQIANNFDRFTELSALFNQKNYNALIKALEKLDSFAEKTSDKIKYYRDFESNFVTKENFRRLREDYFQSTKHFVDSECHRLQHLFRSTEHSDEALAFIKEHYGDILNFNNAEDFIANGNHGKKPNFNKKKIFDLSTGGDTLESVTFKKSRDAIKEAISPLVEFDFDAAFEDLKRVFTESQLLLEMMVNIETAFFNLRQKYSLYTFADVSRLTLKLLNNSEFQKHVDIKKEYKYIFVDEFQDTSHPQNDIVNRLVDNNLFIVGDVKQSIYRFRNAEISIFNNYFDNYKREHGGKTISLSQNFRSRSKVVNTVNRLFKPLFPLPFEGFNYDSQHEMSAANQTLNSSEDPENNYGVVILNNVDDLSLEPKTNKIQKIDAENEGFYEELILRQKEVPEYHLNEVELVLEDIIQRINRGEKVHERGKLVPLRFDHIAILLRRKSNFDDYIRFFNEKNIPVRPIYETSILETDTYFVFKNIIKILSVFDRNNLKPLRRELTSVMRSFLFEYDDQLLYEFNQNPKIRNQKIDRVLDIFTLISLDLNSLSLGELVLKIYQEFDFYNKILKIGNLNLNQQILETMYQFALQASQLQCDLSVFYDLVENFNDKDDPLKFEVQSDVDNAIILSTIHHSKGLQYKYVYLADLKGGSAADKGLSGDYSLSNKYGLVSALNETKSPFHAMANQMEKTAGFAEKIRLFYVAATRAEEKLILVSALDPLAILKPENDIVNFQTMFSFAYYANPFPDIQIQTYDRADSVLLIRKTAVVEDLKIEEHFDSRPVLADPPRVKEYYQSIGEVQKQIARRNSDILKIGTRLHYLFELIDLRNKDTSFITDLKEKAQIENVLKLSCFTKTNKALNIYQEFPYFNEKTQQFKIIDLLVEYEEHFDLIDYKSSDLDNPAYRKQLAEYYNYVRKHSQKPINVYLVSIYKVEMKQLVLSEEEINDAT